MARWPAAEKAQHTIAAREVTGRRNRNRTDLRTCLRSIYTIVTRRTGKTQGEVFDTRGAGTRQQGEKPPTGIGGVDPISVNLELRGHKKLETRFPPQLLVAVICGVTALRLELIDRKS